MPVPVLHPPRLAGLGACCLWLLAACASPPVQEMSDARQAIRAAQSAGAVQRAPESLAEAERLVAEAERQLKRREYRKARQSAVAARDSAGEALQASRAAAAPR